MDRNELMKTWRKEEQTPFVGWDFSYLDGRLRVGPEPWSYLDRAAELLQRSSSLVDIDTGGGEKLLSLQEHWPARVVATEDYLPNFELATDRLAPLGVEVVRVAVSDTNPMPFADDEFELTLVRHAAFNPTEIARILSIGGTLLTQQVHGMWAWDLVAAFDVEPRWPGVTAARNVAMLQALGLTIVDVRELEGSLSFSDVGAIVYYLKSIPWEVPGFTVETHSRYLFALQERLEVGEQLEFYAAKFLIEACKL